jgi:hypothetical protein
LQASNVRAAPLNFSVPGSISGIWRFGQFVEGDTEWTRIVLKAL